MCCARMSAAEEAVADAHRLLVAGAAVRDVRVVSSEIRGAVSVHTMPASVALSSVRAFGELASDCGYGRRAFFASVDGKIVFSVNTKYDRGARGATLTAGDTGATGHTGASATGKKRRRDTVRDEVESAMERVRRSGEQARALPDSAFERVEKTACALLQLTGADSERIIESWAVSVRGAGEWGAGASGGPRLVLAARISAGVAIPVDSAASALKLCTDGMLTVAPARVGRDFVLPMSDEARVAQSSGQTSMLLLVSVQQ